MRRHTSLHCKLQLSVTTMVSCTKLNSRSNERPTGPVNSEGGTVNTVYGDGIVGTERGGGGGVSAGGDAGE